MISPELTWRAGPPPVEEVTRSEEYYWVRGGNFNRPVMVRANQGVNSEPAPTDDEPRKRRFWAELNFQFYAESYPDHIWSSDLVKNYPWFATLEWAGPVTRPED